jgi:hypothetical protein
LPLFVTVQLLVKPAVVSTELGSVTVLPSEIAVPSELLAGAPVMFAVGLTLVTLIVFESVPVPPSLSVALKLTTYEPLSSGVKLSEAPEPVANGFPFLVTVQLFVKPAVVSAELGSATLLPREMAVPSGLEAGAPVIAAVGATLLTVSENWVLAVPPLPSLAVIVTVGDAGPSSGVYDQLHVPDALVPDLVTVPTDALSVTVSLESASDHVPVLPAAEPSFTVTDALFLLMVGA